MGTCMCRWVFACVQRVGGMGVTRTKSERLVAPSRKCTSTAMTPSTAAAVICQTRLRGVRAQQDGQTLHVQDHERTATHPTAQLWTDLHTGPHQPLRLFPL